MTNDPIIKIEQLEKSFGDLHVLKGIDLEVNRGEVVCIIGASGSGKSTLLRCINLLEEADSGHIWFDGQDLMDLKVNLNALRQKIGMVFQGFNLFNNKSVLDNCTLAPMDVKHISKTQAEATAIKHLTTVGLADFIHADSRRLSGGQKQRLITASALATEQRILLLDEPLANLDRKGAAFLMASLRTLAESGYAVLIVEHRLEQVLPFVHEVWRLRNGSLERQTGREALRAAPPETAEHIHAEARREEPVMTLRSVGWRAGGRSILEGVDLTLFQGERLLLLGDNGCGKTSLLRLIARLARPTVGEIQQLIDPALGQRRGSRAWFRRVGVVYQNPNCQLFMPTVAQEVAFAAKSEDFAREIMELFGIAHLAERHPHSLSEGQKRRVSIAAVAASQPELLLLDEPTVGQDREGLRTLLHALNLLHTRTGNTIVTVTHDRRCASALCDRAAWLKDGRIEKTGGPELIEAAWGDSAAM